MDNIYDEDMGTSVVRCCGWKMHPFRFIIKFPDDLRKPVQFVHYYFYLFFNQETQIPVVFPSGLIIVTEFAAEMF